MKNWQLTNDDVATLRAMTEIDIREFADVIARVKREEYRAGATQESLSQLEAHDLAEKSARPGSFFLVAEINTRLVGGVGMVSFDDFEDTCELEKLFLLPEKRGLGIGKVLLQSCLRAAGERGFRCCYLETMSGMTAALKLYTQFGFKPIDRPLRQVPAYLDCWMMLDLARI